MILCIDIGNSHTVLGVYRDEDLFASFRIQSILESTSDEIYISLSGLFAGLEISLSDVTKAVLGSVVPSLTRTYVHFFNKYLSLPVSVIEPSRIPGMKVLIDEPAAVGVDRVVNAYAARELYGTPAIVIDFGTATTFDVVSVNGNYLGGVIAPGLMLSLQALSLKAALLPHIELQWPKTVIGKNTVHAMRSGVFLGAVAMCEGLVERIKLEISHPTPVIVGTGGLSGKMTEASSVLDVVDPELTLKGLRMLADLAG